MSQIQCVITGVLRNETPEEIVRQDFCRALLKTYKYPKENIAVEVPIKMGRSTKRADIVVFRGPDHRQDNAYIIVETKKDQELDGVGQVSSYVSASTAEFGVWTNGPGIRYLQRGPQGDVDIPDIPKYMQSLDAIGVYKKATLDPCTDLKGVFGRCNNYFYVNQGLTQDKRFGEVLKLIFAKIEDEKNVTEPDCSFYITPKERESVAGLQRCRERLDKLYCRVKARYQREGVFEVTDAIKLNDRCLSFAVAELQKYSLLKTDVDVKGMAFETFVGANLRGEHGEFFTPREVVRMAVTILDPKPNEFVLDPACGSGGFLVYALKHVRERLLLAIPDQRDRAEQLGREYAERFIRGIDFNPDLARVAKMNMVLNNDGHAGIFHHDSLTPLEDWPVDLRDKTQVGRVDVLLTNPPFGEKCKIDDKRVLKSFDLAHRWTYDHGNDRWMMTPELQSAVVPDVLFLERCLDLLRPGGRMAIVLPDGILGNRKLGYVRQYLLERAHVLGIVDCPVETFLPSVDTKTSVLFLRRKAALGEPQTFDTFMAIAHTCGHDRRGKTLYQRSPDGTIDLSNNNEPVVDNDLEDIAKEFSAYVESKDLLDQRA